MSARVARQPRLALVPVAVVAVLLGATTLVTGREPAAEAALDDTAFTQISPPSSAPRTTAPPTSNGLVPLHDFRPAERSFQPRPQPKVDVAPRVNVVGPVVGRSHQVNGIASWYCQTGVSPCHRDHSGGLYAAAGPALRVGDWRGRHVRVCAGSNCVTVQLIDWCACGSGPAIDLYSDAFRRLAPLSKGIVGVTVTW